MSLRRRVLLARLIDGILTALLLNVADIRYCTFASFSVLAFYLVILYTVVVIDTAVDAHCIYRPPLWDSYLLLFRLHVVMKRVKIPRACRFRRTYS